MVIGVSGGVVWEGSGSGEDNDGGEKEQEQSEEVADLAGGGRHCVLEELAVRLNVVVWLGNSWIRSLACC